MIRATEARENAKKRLNEIVTKQMSDIESMVMAAINDGEFSVVYSKVKVDTSMLLKDLGYDVEQFDDQVVVSWNENENENDYTDLSLAPVPEEVVADAETKESEEILQTEETAEEVTTETIIEEQPQEDDQPQEEKKHGFFFS